MKRKLLFSMFCLLLIAGHSQAQVVKGRIFTEAGDALPGVSIVVKGTNFGTITNEYGAYSLETNSGGALIYSFIGYQTQEQEINGRSEIDITLLEDNSTLGEVVVTGFGVERERRILGYATSTIEADQITKTASPNFATALYGKAPGVTIQATPGGATSGVSVTIRGLNSITGNTQPLYVIDGVPIRSGDFNNTSYWNNQRIQGNGVNDINPADIEDISILKGASAAALYGSEAVNGVILITTKSGKGRKGLGIDFTASYSNDKIAYQPKFQNVRGPGYPAFLNPNSGQDENGFLPYSDGARGLIGTSVNFGPKFDGQPIRAWTGETVPYVNSADDNYNGLFRDANSSNVNIGISNAYQNGNFRFSFTRQDNQMISIDSKNTKNIFNLNNTINIGKRSKTDLVISYINQETKNRPYVYDRLINNFSGMMDRFDRASWYVQRNVTSLGYRYVTGTNPSFTPDENITGRGFRGDVMDFVYRTHNYKMFEKSNRVLASVTETFTLAKGLSLRGRIGSDITTENNEERRPTDVPAALGGKTGMFGLSNNVLNLLYGDIFLTYTTKFNEDYGLTLFGGYTAKKLNNSYQTQRTNGGLSTDNVFDLAASNNTIGTSSRRNNFLTDAYLGSVNFNYKEYFNIEGTFRRDRTSTMSPKANSFFYPSVNTAFVFSDALNFPNWYSYGKLRGSWGIVGNYPTAYSANIAYNQGTYNIQRPGGSPVLYTDIPGNFGNDNIRPEQKHEFEIGLESQFLNGRYGLDFSYYNAQVRDQILPLTLAPSQGASSVLANIGTLRNSGIELSLNARPFNMQYFSWNVILNLAKNYNKVEKLANNSTELLHQDFDGNAAQIRSVVGRPMGDIYVHPVKQVNGEKVVIPGGLYQLDADEWIVAGNAMPKLIGGLINQFSFNNFTFDANIDFRLGGAVMPTGLNWMTSRGLTEESLNYMDKEHGGLSYYRDEKGKGVQTDQATGPNGEKVFHDGILLDGVTVDSDGNTTPNTNVISQTLYYLYTYNWGGPQYGYSRYELYVKENTYVKMREMALGFNFPSRLAEKIGAQNINLSVFGRNLFFFYRSLKNMDPEQTTAGSYWYNNINNAGNNPSYRTFGAMIRASF